jgi:fumarate reductase flavoprotein subunit
MFVDTAPKAVRELAAWGVPWSRVRRGDREVIINSQKVTITERDEAHGLISQRDFGGTKKWRTCHVSDGTGHAMLQAVADQAIADAIPVHERTEALALIHDGHRCYGAVVRDLIDGTLAAYLAKATAIATGGAGRLYRVTTNAVICEGIGHALALETGVAALGNMEAVQFHPTGIFPAGILVTEGCRGDGGLLKDANGHRFMPDYEPEKKELASRDVVSRRMEQHIASGKGVKSRFGEHLWLDITLLGEKHIRTQLREVYEICQSFLGTDPTKDFIAVRPAQHYTMGGVRTKPSGEIPSLAGLFAAGEAACWDMHGFNRLGGNSAPHAGESGTDSSELLAGHARGTQTPPRQRGDFGGCRLGPGRAPVLVARQSPLPAPPGMRRGATGGRRGLQCSRRSRPPPSAPGGRPVAAAAGGSGWIGWTCSWSGPGWSAWRPHARWPSAGARSSWPRPPPATAAACPRAAARSCMRACTTSPAA